MELYRKVLKAYEKTVGLEHPDALRTANNLAICLMEAGHHAEAQQEFYKILPVRRRVLGADHPAVTRTCCDLAKSLRAVGKFDEAIDVYKQVLTSQQRAAGGTDTIIITSVQGHIADCMLGRAQARNTDLDDPKSVVPGFHT